MIGGAACWFYRHQLKKAGDPDFQVAPFAREKENQWLSRDLDFTGIFSQEALHLLPHLVVEHKGRKHVEVDGVRLGFAQVGLTIDPEEALTNARVAAITVEGRVVEFLVADPLTVGAEKLLGDEGLSAGEAKLILQIWINVKNKTPEILQDARLRKRLEPWQQVKSTHPIFQFLAGN